MIQRFIHQIARQVGRCLPIAVSFVCLVFSSCGDTPGPQPLTRDFSNGTIKAHTGPVTAVLVTPDGKQIISAGRDGRLVIWDVASKTAVVELLGKGDQLRSAVITGDGKFVAAGSEKGIVNVFDLENRKPIRQINAGNDSILAVAFDSKGSLLISGGKDKQVKAWTIAGDAAPKLYEGSFDRIDATSFSPDDKQILAGSAGIGIRVWRLSDGKPQESHFQYNGEIYCLATSKDRGLIVAGGTAGDVKGLHDGKVKIWSYADGKEVLSFAPHRLVTSSVSISNQNNILATASTTDTVVRLWDIDSGKYVASLVGHLQGVNSVCFSADGSLLVSGAEDGTIKIWNIHPSLNAK